MTTILPLLIALMPAVGDWIVEESVTGGYSIAFPARPDRRNEQASSPTGSVEVPTIILQRDDVVYAIFHHDNPPIAATSVERYLDNLSKGRKSQGKVLGEKPLKIGGCPAREVLVETPETATSPACFHRVRFVVDGARLYQMMVVCPADRTEATASDAAKFFDSFRIEKDARVAQTGHLDSLERWLDFRSDPGRFEIRLPEKPKEETQDVDTGMGLATIAIITANDDRIGYITTYRDVDLKSSRKARQVFDGLRNLVVSTSKGTLLDGEKTIHLGRASGREFRAEVPLGDDPKGAILRCRLYLSGRRLYQVMAVSPKAMADSAGPSAYFQSFHILAPR